MRLMGILLMAGFLISSVAAEPQKQANKGSSSVKQSNVSVEKIMEGMMVSIDKAKQVFVVSLRGKEYEFTVDAATTITINEEKQGFDALCSGAAVRVIYVRDGKGTRIAKTITQNLPIKKSKDSKTSVKQNNVSKEVEKKSTEPKKQPAQQQPAQQQPAQQQPAQQQPAQQQPAQQQPAQQQPAQQQPAQQQPAQQQPVQPKK